MSDLLGGRLDSNEIRERILAHKFPSGFKPTKQLIDAILEKFWFQDIFNSFISEENNLKSLIEYISDKKPVSFNRFDFYTFYFDKKFSERKDLQNLALYFEKVQTDRLLISEFKELISEYNFKLEELEENKLIKTEKQEDETEIAIWNHHTLSEFLTAENFLEKEDTIEEFARLAVLEQEGVTAFKPSWTGVLCFLLDSKKSKDVILWFINFLEKHPENIDDNLSEIAVSLNIKDDGLKKRIFDLIYSSYFDRVFWLPYKVRSEFHKFIDAESYKRIKRDIKKWPDITETFVKRGNSVGIVEGLLENKIDLLTKGERDFWKEKLIKFSNNPEDDGNGVLQRFSLAALAYYKDPKIIPLVAESCFDKSKDKLVKDEFMQFCYNSDPNSRITIGYLIEGIKKGSNIYARYGLYKITSKASIKYLFKEISRDIQFWESFMQYGTVFSKSEGDQKIIENIQKNRDKKIVNLLKKSIFTIFESSHIHQEKSSFFVNAIVEIINSQDSNFLFDIIDEVEKKEDKDAWMFFHDAKETIARLITKENLEKYLTEIKKTKLRESNIELPIYVANAVNKPVYEYAIKKGVIKLPKDYPKSKWDKTEEEREKELVSEFHNLLEPSPGKYIPSVFKYYVDNKEKLDEFFKTKDGQKAKERFTKLAVDEGIRKINPREFKVTISDKSKEGGRQFTWSSVASYYGDLLSVIKILAPEELKKHRQNIIDFIPYAFSDDMSTIMDLILEIKDKELAFVNKVMSDEKDDRRYLIPGTYIYLVGHYAKKRCKLPSALPVLKSFVGDEFISDYEQESAIEKLVLFIDENNKDIKRFLEDVFKDEEKNGEKNKLAIASNEVLIKVYKDEKAIDWRFEQLKKPLVYERKKVEGIAHEVSPAEHEIYDMPFAGPLTELGDEKYLDKFLDLLNYSFDFLQKNEGKQQEYWEYVNYLWRTVISYIDNLKTLGSFIPVIALRIWIEKHSGIRNINWLKARAKELEKNYINQVKPIDNLIQSVNNFSKNNDPLSQIALFIIKAQLVEFKIKELILGVDYFLEKATNTHPIYRKQNNKKNQGVNKLTLGNVIKELENYGGKSNQTLCQQLSNLKFNSNRNKFAHKLFEQNQDVNVLSREASTYSKDADKILTLIQEVWKDVLKIR